MKLSHSQKILVTEIARRANTFESAEEPPQWAHWPYADYLDQKQNGVRYSHSRWFGKQTSSQRMRWYRALRALEQAELIEVTRVEALRSRQQVYLRLTPAGEKLARELLARESNN